MATIRAVIVESDIGARVTDIEDSLGAFQAAVGGYIEPVSGKVATIYADEDGLLKSLPMNPVATHFAQRVLGAGVVLHGTVVIVGPPDNEGNDTPVRQSVVDYFTMEV